MSILQKIKKRHLLAPIVYNISSIFVFFIIYVCLRDQFKSNKTNDKMNLQDAHKAPSPIDMIELSITLQNAVGVPMVYPTTFTAKLFTVLQQFLLVFGNLLVFYLIV